MQLQRLPEVLLIIALVIVGAVLLNGSIFQNGHQSALPPENTLFQYSTIDALLQGLYDGGVTMQNLTTHGDLGIGTFDHLDGEMIVLNGTVYQARADGTVTPAPPEETTPFAAVTFFKFDRSYQLSQLDNISSLTATIDTFLPGKNHFSMIRIDGTFPTVKVRSVPAQQRPYPKMEEAVKEQKVYNLSNVTGTVVGVWSPAFVQGINVPGYHLHFISADRKTGGHILDIATGQATLSLDEISRFTMELPTSGDFLTVDLSGNQSAALGTVEKGAASAR
jgi:acetolactate decarboxylase